MSATELDLDAVRRDIDAEVRRRRASGEIPADLERELDAVFSRFAPPAVSDDFDEVLARADRDAVMTPDVPLESRLPGVPLVKKVLRKLMHWYVRFITQQVTGFAATMVRAVRLLGRRVDRLEATVPALDPRLADVVPGLLPAADAGVALADVVTAVGEPVAGLPGRVAVVESGSGELLLALRDAGVDAYGVDPDAARADALALAHGADVRLASALDHLRRLPEASLAGVVLTGCSERLPAGDLVELAARAAAARAPGGVVAVLSATPEAWAHAVGSVAADLAPGRPLAAATWLHVLGAAGIGELRVLEGARVAEAPAVPDGVADAAAINAALAALAAAVHPPRGYLVVGLRPR